MSCFLSCLQRLADSSERVVRNYDDLKTESDRLETHVKQACSSWILVMLVVVILTFVWMVLFMKMFPKT
jgi:SNARE protein 1